MIPVGENQVYNKVVFTDGKQASYTIDYIVEIYCENENNLDNAQRLLYEQEKNGIPTKTTNLFKIYYPKDFRYSDFRARIGKSSENSGNKQDGTGSIGETQEQRRDTALTDREILELAANELVIDNLTEAEQSALEIFKNRLDY